MAADEHDREASHDAAADTEHDARRDAQRVGERSHPLLPEEESAGSQDREGQAAAILEDSLERTDGPEPAPDHMVEHRSSDEAT